MEWQESGYLELKQVLEKDHETLLNELKEYALNVEITRRKEFENHLLKLAQEITDENKRRAVYEVLVSLKNIWEQFKPEKGLQEKFRTAFNGKNYKEAEIIYQKLSRQGLDYLGTFTLPEGKLQPLIHAGKEMILHFNKTELNLYSLQFELLLNIPMKESLCIIDVVSPSTCQEMMGTNIEESEITDPKIWILLEETEERKLLKSITIKINENREDSSYCLGHLPIALDKTLGDVFQLSCFQNHLLLVTKKSIYYYKENNQWDRWYLANGEITAVESTNHGFWVGHSGGEVIVLKNLLRVGARSVFEEFSEEIRNIWATEKYVLICSKNCLRIVDFTVRPVSGPMKTQCHIMQATMQNDFLLMLLTNGMLMARDFKQENICWQINLGNQYETLFNFREYFYCSKGNGETILLETPDFHILAKKLGSINIIVKDESTDVDPHAPIKYISDFFGRKEILTKIKNSAHNHFIFYGEPRVGKTSLLNVMRDILAEHARCCVVDMPQLLKDKNSCEAFELKFMEECLGQHFIKLSELPGIGGYRYQAQRAMIKKIKGNKDFCVIGLDNFQIPDNFDEKSKADFKNFLRSLMLHTEVRIMIACNSKEKDRIEKYIDQLVISPHRQIDFLPVSLLSQVEVKYALRKKLPLHQNRVDDVYAYIGRFPHLIHLYDRWNPGNISLQEQSIVIAKTFGDNIFEYFRDFSLNARLLIATCLYENLFNDNVDYKTFYEKFPLLKNTISTDNLEAALDEINQYGSGLLVTRAPSSFKISFSEQTLLFFEAAKHIPWMKGFKTLYQFASLPNRERAHEVADTFAGITQSGLDPIEFLDEITEKHREKFYVNKLTEQGLQALRMPLTTFVVIALKPWQRDVMLDSFLDLYSEFQELGKKKEKKSRESIGQMFYILLFDLHGISMEIIKKDMEGLDRISIIDATMMKDIFLARFPQDKASEYIFSQLSIKERSPYTTAGAVPDSLFFGRQMELALIRGLPENIGIFGTRTIGKTSLLRRLHRIFQAQKQWKVFDMDCSRIESEETLLKNLAEKMAIPFDLIPNMEEFRKYVTKDAESGGYRYLFLLDEVDRLVEYDIKHDEKIFNTFNRLCNETMKNQETAARFILFGFQQMFTQMKNPRSRLYNFMVFMPLQALDKEGAMTLVTRPIENIRVRWFDKKDAEYLVDSCSGHPRLLQAACHVLLATLDSKGENRDSIERFDVDKALSTQDFRELCLRAYHDHEEGFINKRSETEKEKAEPGKKTLLDKFLHKNTGRKKDEPIKSTLNTSNNKGKEFLGDLHRITILAAIRLLYEEHNESFSIADLRNELMRHTIDVSPNIMRNVLDQLCLSGNFRLKDESTIITLDSAMALSETEKIKGDNTDIKLAVGVDHPDVYASNEATFPKYIYEFGVKIFPKLLVATFGGLALCREEQRRLIDKGDWQEWLRRY